MRPASVGFQCPECVSEGAKGVRQPSTVFGGRVTADTSRITMAIIAVNVAVFVMGLALGEGALQLRFGNLAGPAVFERGGEVQGVATGQLYRLITAAFLHAGIFHIVLNMLVLAQLGPILERALGRVRFAVLYLLSALGGSTLSYLVSDPGSLGVGASGAIYGLFGAYFVVVRRLGGETRPILILLAINLVITFTVPIIDWRAHVGGLVVGAALAAVLAYAPRGPRRTLVQTAGCAAAALVILVAVALRTAALGG